MDRLAVFIAALMWLGSTGPLPLHGAAADDGRGDDILATVNGEAITVADLDAALSAAVRKAPGGDPFGTLTSQSLLKRLTQNLLLEQEAYRMGLQETPEVMNQVWEFVRHKSMMALLDSIASEVGDPEPAVLDSLLGRASTMHRLSHLVVPDEAAARALADSLAAGVPFPEIADRHSTDGRPGGDLGWAKEGSYIPEFETALAGLAIGEVSAPFRTEKGWHLIMRTDSRAETSGQSDAMEEAIREAVKRERIMAAVEGFVASLREKHRVVVNDSLLASLDYGSEDPAVQERLRNDEGVLVELPWRRLTVRELSRTIRFEHYHGLQGKPDAAAIRDEAFEEWLTELLLRHEASALGFDKRPEITAEAAALEKQLVQEAVLGVIAGVPFAPDEQEVEAYHARHRETFRPEPRVKVDGVLIGAEDAARAFHAKVEEGTAIGWLAARTPEIVDRSPAAFAGWVDVRILGLEDAPLLKGMILGPFEFEELWAVAKVLDVEEPEPLPLEACREGVLQRMRGEATREALREAVARLESESEIVVMSGAYETIDARRSGWSGGSAP
jgi:hypothetical protein